MTIYGFHKLTSTLKSMETVGSDERYFEGLLTVQMKDKQGEITIVDELYKVLPIWIDRGAPISDTHSNRIVGKGINYSRTTVKNEQGEELPAIKITGKIFKNYELDNVIWEKIKSKEYQGLSFGGATRSARSPIKMKDGSIAYALSDLEHYEVAVCKDPAVPMAIITDFNQIAKSTFNSFDRGDGKMVIQCDNMGCYVKKTEEDEEEKIGMKVETAFTEDKKEAEDSVENHLKKDPKHYSRLRDVLRADEDKPLNKPMRDDGDKKFKVYVKDPNTGKIVIVRFGDPNMEIKRDDPERRASFRARHDCDNAKDITTPKYWSCKMWEKETSVTDQIDKTNPEKLTEKEKEQKQFAMGEELEAIQYQLGSKKDIDDSLLIKSKNKTLDETKKAFKIVEKIVPLIAQAILPMLTGGGEEEEEVEKADLSKLSTFKGKEQALIDEGKSKESAEKIVGSFVKHENKADASMSSTTEGANNPRYSDPDPEDDNPETIMNRAKVVGTKQEMYKSQEKEFDEESGQSHANTNGDGNQGSQDVGRQSWAGSGSPYPKIIDESRKNKIKSINLDCNILKNKLKRL